MPGVHVPSTDGSARGLIAVSDMAVRPEETLAHELGHHCGLARATSTSTIRAPLTSRGFPCNIMFLKVKGSLRDTFYRDQIRADAPEFASLKLGP